MTRTEALLQAAWDGDHVARLALADNCEEIGERHLAAFYRWLAAHPSLIRMADPDPESMYHSCRYLDIDDLPEGIVDRLPPPMINDPGQPEDANSFRVLPNLWVSCEHLESDLYMAWIGWQSEPEPMPLFEG